MPNLSQRRRKEKGREIGDCCCYAWKERKKGSPSRGKQYMPGTLQHLCKRHRIRHAHSESEGAFRVAVPCVLVGPESLFIILKLVPQQR